MSNLFATPWTTSEKIVLLTNIIQGAVQDAPSFLLHAMENNNIQPRWDDIALPQGRSVNACRDVYESMIRAPRPPPRSFASVGLHGYAPQPLGPNVAPVRAVSEHELPPPTHRTLQPRPPRSTDSPVPPTTNGEAFQILRPFAPPEIGVERRKKRGRPTKEEAEERDRLLRAAGQTYEPKRRPAKKPRPSDTPGSASEALPGTSPGLQTPQLERAEPREETSSGKKRSRRQREEEDLLQRAAPRSPLDDSGNERNPDVAQSPSDRLLLRSNERALAGAPVARDLQLSQGSFPKQEPQLEQDDQQSGPPSV